MAHAPNLRPPALERLLSDVSPADLAQALDDRRFAKV